MTKDEIDTSGAPHPGIRSTSPPSKEGEMQALNAWMREPDYAENFSLEDMASWINRRPIALVARLAAIEQSTRPPSLVDREAVARIIEEHTCAGYADDKVLGIYQ